jgi:SWI/SNF related-matrix-associated actin-dependent regulator of chromatin subfamily C
MYSGDFVRMDEEAFKQASSGAGAEWSDQETLLLLEGVEMYDDDWQAVAEHVGTRTKEQCIANFLQIPIEDSYLTSDPAADLGPLRYHAGMNGLPFEGKENAVMSVVTFLASAVGPAVAAAAAQSALGELSQGLKRKRANGDDSKADGVKAEGADGEKESTDAMAVDGEASPAPAAETNGDAPSKSSVERAASIALGSAAAKASALARHEDARISQLVSRLVAAQVKKVELKLSMFERLEELLESEKRKVEVGRQELFRDKLQMSRSVAAVEGILKRAKEGGDLAGVEKEVKDVKAGMGGSTSEAMREVQGGGASLPNRQEGTYQQL